MSQTLTYISLVIFIFLWTNYKYTARNLWNLAGSGAYLFRHHNVVSSLCRCMCAYACVLMIHWVTFIFFKLSIFDNSIHFSVIFLSAMFREDRIFFILLCYWLIHFIQFWTIISKKIKSLFLNRTLQMLFS